MNSTSTERLSEIESRVQTLIEVRPAGMSGTDVSKNKPFGGGEFNSKTLEKVQQISHASSITNIEEYIYKTQIDTSRPNALSILIGLRPESEMRAPGEIDYEHARIIAGQRLNKEDTDKKVAVVGRLYAKQRLDLTDTDIQGYKTGDKMVEISGEAFTLKGIYETGNDLGENHVFIPIEPFRKLFDPGDNLSRIFVTVDSVQNVETVAQELKSIQEADVLTTPGAVSVASQYIKKVAEVSKYTLLIIVISGAALVTFTMILSLKERVSEVGVLKAIGASNLEVATQFIAESIGMTFFSGLISIILFALSSNLLSTLIRIPLALTVDTLLTLLWVSLLFGFIGSLYPVIRGVRISPVEAIKKSYI
jgi:ABC-type antimicrobial peptide transport system permease subunit